MYLSYLRVSSPGQVGGDGFDRQRETIKRWGYCQPHEVRIGQEFMERGVSGAAFERPALASLLVYCREMRNRQTQQLAQAVKNPYSMVAEAGSRAIQDNLTVLIERSDRLARENLTAELILREFRALDVKVIDCEAGVELTNDDNPSSVLIRQILQAVAEFEKSSLVKKLKKARDRKRAKEGRCDGAKPYGHYEDEKVTAAYIAGLRFDNTPAEIARILNEEGRKTRKGTAWNRGTVWRLIKRLDAEKG